MDTRSFGLNVGVGWGEADRESLGFSWAIFAIRRVFAHEYMGVCFSYNMEAIFEMLVLVN
jgi:hypothetical protein